MYGIERKQAIHKNNIYKKLLKNRLSFLCIENNIIVKRKDVGNIKYFHNSIKINEVKDKYA